MQRAIIVTVSILIIAIVIVGVLVWQTSASNKTAASPSPTPAASGSVSSLQSTDVKVGTGAVAADGDTITVSYVGTLTDGTVFDSSAKDGQNFTFKLGAGQVIPGWDQGVVGMRVGGERKLIIPPSLGYGDQANGAIPANSTLIFDITLLSVTPGE